jgi:hypothetical protein
MKKARQLKIPTFGQPQAQQAVNRQQNLQKNPVTKAAASEQIVNMIKETGVPAWAYVEIGKQAEMAIHDKSKYPMFVKFMVDRGLETEEDLKEPNLPMLAMLVTIGKVAETLPNSTMPTQPQGQ